MAGSGALVAEVFSGEHIYLGERFVVAHELEVLAGREQEIERLGQPLERQHEVKAQGERTPEHGLEPGAGSKDKEHDLPAPERERGAGMDLGL